MSPRRLGVVSRMVVCWNASSARKSCRATCQYARRANSADPATAKAIRRTSARARESVRPIGRSAASARVDDERGRELGQARVDRQLAHRGLLAEPVEVGQQLLLADDQGVALPAEP